MGCSNSKLDDAEAVQLCKDRKRFIKQAIEYRSHFAAGHVAYIQSLKRVFTALRNYVEGDESHDYFCDSYRTPIFTPTKKRNPEIVAIPIKSFSPSPFQSNTGSRRIVNYLRTGGNPSVSIEERPQSPETVRVEAYSPMYQYGIDGFFAMDPSHSATSFYPSPYNNRPAFPPPSPQNSQWDFFWNPFTSLDSYGYPYRDSFDRTGAEHDEIRGLRQVREEEGIPDLEEEDEEEETSGNNGQSMDERANVDTGSATENGKDEAPTSEATAHDAKGLESQPTESVEVAETQKNAELKVSKEDETALGEATEAGEETPGFTVYVNRRSTSMAEVIKDLEIQFTEICNVANEISTLLKASSAQYSTSNELTAAKMLNPVALFRSASSRSTSSRLFTTSSGSRDGGGYESNSDISEDSFMSSGNHQSTLDRLYAWEKKLYEQVKSGEKIRIAYEKKCMQLRSQDVKGDDPAAVDKTRAAIRDLHTQIKVSIHSVEAISKRIETLRDEELHPQLIELIQGLARMWRTMAERHNCQKHTVDDAKLLLASTPTKCSNKVSPMSSPPARRPVAHSASALESELRNWRACFQSWIAAQRSYVRALTGWALRCVRSDDDDEKLPFSPRRSSPAPPIFSLCVLWSRFLDPLDEASVTEGLDFFAAGIGSMYGQMREEEAAAAANRSSRRMSGGGEIVTIELAEEKAREEEKTAEVAVKVLFAGMAVAVSSLTEFAVSSAEGYEAIVKQWEKDTWDKVKVGA